MANCIAIDASSETCSVSLVLDGKTTNASSDIPKSHAKSLLPFVHKLLIDQRTTLANMHFIACSEGPGSFTGLRIGLGVAQGLAFGAGKPMVGVSSLESMARSAKVTHPQAGCVVSVLDARMGEIYWSATTFSGGDMTIAMEPRLDSVEEVDRHIQQLFLQSQQTIEHPNQQEDSQTEKMALVAGSAIVLLNHEKLTSLGVVLDTQIAPCAETIAQAAIEKWHAGLGCQPQDFQLNYLRNSVSWNKRQRIRS